MLNNGVHESVGGQPSAGYMVDLTSIAKASGFNTIGKAVKTSEELKTALEILNGMEGPCFIDVHIRLGIRSCIPELKVDHKELKTNLMATLNKRK